MNPGKSNEIRILGVPMDLGASRRGTDMGPSALRIAGVGPALRNLGFQVAREQDVQVPSMETRETKDEHARFLDEIHHVCTRLANRVEGVLEMGARPLVMGGDHSIAVGTVTGVSSFFRRSDDQIGLLWFDAHADMNTPKSSPTGNIHGMPLAHLLGMGEPLLSELGGFSPKVRPENVALVGIRALDRKEKMKVADSGINVFTMSDIDKRGMGAVADEVVNIVTDGTVGFHVSFDVDGLDPEVAPGVGTPVQGGINYREAHLLLEHCADTGLMTSMEVVELNPVLDNRNQSALVMRALILSAFGMSIL